MDQIIRDAAKRVEDARKHRLDVESRAGQPCRRMEMLKVEISNIENALNNKLDTLPLADVLERAKALAAKRHETMLLAPEVEALMTERNDAVRDEKDAVDDLVLAHQTILEGNQIGHGSAFRSAGTPPPVDTSQPAGRRS